MVEGICMPLDVRHDLVRMLQLEVVAVVIHEQSRIYMYMTISFGDDYIE